VVTVLDDLSTGKREHIDSSLQYDFVQGSVADRNLVSRLVSQADYVAHLATRNIIVSTKNPLDDFETNIGGTLNVLLAARENPGVRVLYTSSSSIYGNPRHLPITEDETPLTFSPYAVSKLAAENYCTAFYETYGVAVSALRLSNVYGPKQNPANPYCGVVSRFISAVGSGKPIMIHGDGLQTRDFTFVDDVVEAAMFALVSPHADGMVFNVGSGIETSILELARQIAVTVGAEADIAYVDRRDIDNIRRRVLNIERIRSRLRWQPRTPLHAGIRKTVAWWRQLPAENRSGGERAKPASSVVGRERSA
jgi:UDP-glucose 4-epimerase